MFTAKMQVTNLEEFQKHLDFVKKMLSMKTDKSFQDFIKNKVLDLANKVTDERLLGGTTNDEVIEAYRTNHKIRDYEEGFILYNDTKIPANSKDTTGYEDGNFCIALAFEYGVGIVGEQSNNSENAWQYDINNYGQSGWVFVLQDGTWERTRGYAGFEIYRNIAIQVSSNIKDWVMEFFKEEV